MGIINFFKKPKLDLLKADFEYKDVDNFEEEDINFKIIDNLEVEDYDDEKVYLLITRKVFFDPEIFFNICVKVRVSYELKDDLKGEELNKSNLKKEIEKNKNRLTPVLEKISLLIGNITNIDDNLSVVTPPVFQDEK